MSESSDIIPLDSSNFCADENSSDDDVEEELRPHGKKICSFSLEKNHIHIL